MDVTYTNVLQGARQYFQGIPSSSNASVRISNLQESHCRIPVSRNQEFCQPEQLWSDHVTVSPRLQSRNDSPVRQPASHVPNSNSQHYPLQYNKEKVDKNFSHYTIPYNERNGGAQEQQAQFRHNRISHMDHCEQELHSKEIFLVQQSQQYQQPANQQQVCFQQQAQHHSIQNSNYPYIQQSTKHDFQYPRLLSSEAQSNSSPAYNSMSPYQQSQEQLKSQYFHKVASNIHNSHQDVQSYSVPPKKQSTPSYPSGYELKQCSGQRNSTSKKTLNNPLECYALQKNVCSKNVSVKQNYLYNTPYMNSVQTTPQTDNNPKTSTTSTYMYEPAVTLQSITPITSQNNRESIISSMNICRTRDIIATQTSMISQQQNSYAGNNNLTAFQRHNRQQSDFTQGNFELSQPQYQYANETKSELFDTHENSGINNTYMSVITNDYSSSRGTEVNNTSNLNSPRMLLSNHEQIDSYLNSYGPSNNNGVRKESPLDLSLRTIKTSADSTLNETESDMALQTLSNKSSKKYPQFDIELFEKNLTQRSSEVSNVADPRFDCKPNFGSTSHSSKSNYFPKVNDSSLPKQTDSFGNQIPTSNIRYLQNKPNASILQSKPNHLHSSQRPPIKIKRHISTVNYPDQSASNTSNIKKRPLNATECVVFNKIPKIIDPWRRSIDMQIEERLSSYKKQQKKLADDSHEQSFFSSNIEQKRESPRVSQHFEKMVNSLACSVEENQPYSNITTNNCTTNLHSGSPTSNSKIQNNRFFGADKRVLNILRSSLEIKGKKKMEQQKANEGFSHRYDLENPLHPDNISATVNKHTSDTSTNSFKITDTPSDIPRVVDAVNLQSNNFNNSRDPPEGQDNFAEFLAARIRTKGELKQGGSISDNHNSIANQEFEPPEKQLPSENPSSIMENGSFKTQNITQRKRVFSKNEEGTSNTVIPNRNKCDQRSSSETSVFDFPGSDSENEDKESLETMRKCRKSKQDIVLDIKIEPSLESVDSVDDDFMKVCENFVQELKGGINKKPKRKKPSDFKVEDSVVTKERSGENFNDQDGIDIFNEKTEHMLIETQENNNCSIDENLCQKESNNNMHVINSPNNNGAKLATSITENDFTSEKILFEKNDVDFKEILPKDIKCEECPNIESENHEKVSESNVPIPPVNKGDNILKNDCTKSSESSTKTISIIRPSKKPSFGDPSYFYPGWEEGVYKYKKSLRIPPTLIQISRPPQFHRISTSLPDLDPYPQSPMVSSPNDNTSKLTQTKSESLGSDNESDYNFNVFGKKTNYDSESSTTSALSSPNSTKELSILDKLLEKYGRNRERKYRRSELRQRKLEESGKAFPSTSVETKEEHPKKRSLPNEVKPVSTLSSSGKTATTPLKESFMKTPDRNENDGLPSVILKARTRKETRILKQRATIKEVFGEERPASAPPTTSLNGLNFKKGIFDEDNCLGKLVIKLEKRDDMIDKIMQKQKKMQIIDGQTDIHNFSEIITNEIKTEVEQTELEHLDEKPFKNYLKEQIENQLMQEYDNITRGRKRNRTGKIRRKLSSGFDYIRKKKKVKKELIKKLFPHKKEIISEKIPETIHDIHKEIKSWVLNKGIGETHLHRAARLGYTDITAFCLEKLDCNPSPKDNAGYTPLHEACSRGHLDIAKILLMYGANPSESAQGGVRPLHEACENGYVEITRLLLAYGADPTLVTYSGLTPLALTNDENTKNFLRNHLNDVEGEPSIPWTLFGPASLFDPLNTDGYNLLDDVPDADAEPLQEDIQFEVADKLLPNFYTLQNEPRSDRWILLQDLFNLLKIKSKDALLRQITQPSTTNYKSVFKEMKMTDFLEQAQCCQFLNLGEKINSRASKIALVKYTKKLRELLNIETVTITR